MSQERISIQRQEELIALLKATQNNFGYVPPEIMGELAESLDIPLSEVFGVASFYSFLSTEPLGKNVIRVCKSLPCYLKYCQDIIESIEKTIKIKPGETTPDGKFSLQLTNCIGVCDKAPVMMINNDIHVDLTPRKIRQILGSYK